MENKDDKAPPPQLKLEENTKSSKPQAEYRKACCVAADAAIAALSPMKPIVLSPLPDISRKNKEEWRNWHDAVKRMRKRKEANLHMTPGCSKNDESSESEDDDGESRVPFKWDDSSDTSQMDIDEEKPQDGGGDL